MTERSGAPTSSPLPSFIDIQKRLVRPSAIFSPARGEAQAVKSSQLNRNLNLTQFKRKQESGEQSSGEATKRLKKKLEDYLDPVLLSAISAKIGTAKNDCTAATKLKKREAGNFDWPVDELKVFAAESKTTISKIAVSENDEAATDLSCDEDLIKERGDGEEKMYSPFKRFEKTALKLFKA